MTPDKLPADLAEIMARQCFAKNEDTPRKPLLIFDDLYLAWVRGPNGDCRRISGQIRAPGFASYDPEPVSPYPTKPTINAITTEV